MKLYLFTVRPFIDEESYKLYLMRMKYFKKSKIFNMYYKLTTYNINLLSNIIYTRICI